jgi:hypothetical protein
VRNISPEGRNRYRYLISNSMLPRPSIVPRTTPGAFAT